MKNQNITFQQFIEKLKTIDVGELLDKAKSIKVEDIKSILSLLLFIFTFKDFNKSSIEKISDRLGTFETDILSWVNKDAAKIGSAEFLDPLILIFPWRDFPPVISILSIVITSEE